MSPVLFNKIVSGQLAYLVSYAALPLALFFCDAALQRGTARDVLILVAMLVLSACEVQIGIVAIFLVVLYALILAQGEWRVRLCSICLVLAVFAAAETPVIVGMLTQSDNLIRSQEFSVNLAWLDANSVPPQDAIRLLGYVAHYFDQSVQALGVIWLLASWAFVAWVAFGFVLMPVRLRIWCLIPYVLVIVAIGGAKGVFGPVMSWLFMNVPPMHVFRELYHLMIVPALCYALAIGYSFERVCNIARERQAFAPRALPALLVVCFLAYVWPMLTGNVGGWVKVLPTPQDLTVAYEHFGVYPNRVAWFPIDQPLAFEHEGAGVDPLAITPAGSLWQYNLEWPLTALDLEMRDAQVEATARSLRVLSAGAAVFRSHFTSQLPHLLYQDTRIWHYFAPGSLPNRALGARTLDVASAQAYALAPIPRAFAANSVAYVPARLKIISRAT
ncbi:MAG TPA: hypothetical protein VME66_12710, partial [Candidatus Acidoferrales bacterium]|nr:hypothetical protein [Candidatus Acidoferrales bacterium]